FSQSKKKIFIKMHGWGSDETFVNHDANRVRANINNGDRFEALQTTLSCGWTHAVAFLSACARFRCAIKRGADDFIDFPRPDKLGLVMKYSCALKASSSGSFSNRRKVPSASSS